MIQIPAIIVYATVLAALGLVGSLITAVYRLSARVRELEVSSNAAHEMLANGIDRLREQMYERE